MLDSDDDDSQCPYGKTFGVDGDMADKTCLKCKKMKDLLRQEKEMESAFYGHKHPSHHH